MKMDQADFLDLKNDFFRVVETAKAIKPANFGALTMRDAWSVLHRVEQERSYSDDIRAQLETVTGIPCSVARREDYRMGYFYSRGLNDAHIETALRRILAS